MADCRIRKVRKNNHFATIIIFINNLTMDGPSTRSETKLYPDFGIETSLDELRGSQVPSNLDALRHFFHFHVNLKESLDKSCKLVAANLLKRWKGSNVPLLQPVSISKIVKKLHEELS